MVAAMEAVKDGTISINKSALLHGVPPATLKGHLNGRVKYGAKPGPKDRRCVIQYQERTRSLSWVVLMLLGNQYYPW